MSRATDEAAESVEDAALVVGDTIRMLGGWSRVTAIRPYTGPLTDIVFAIAETVPRGAISLCHGGYSERLKR